jgi:hypothetical protein
LIYIDEILSVSQFYLPIDCTIVIIKNDYTRNLAV